MLPNQLSADNARMRNVAFRGRPARECLEPFDNESMFRFFLGSSSDERQLPCCTEDDTKQDVATTTEETTADVSESCRQCSDEEARAGR